MSAQATNAHEVVLAGGATLRFVTPNSAAEAHPDKLPRFEVAGLPGARITVRRGFLDDAGVTLHVACVEAPSDRWAPGIEDVVLGVASGVAHRAMSERMALEPLEVGSIVSLDQHFEQKLSSRGAREGSPVKLLGKHVLGFEGPRSDVVLCTVMCDEPREHAGCADVVARANLAGLVPAPPPSLLVRTVLFAAEKPWDAGALAGVLGLLLVGLVLAKRPRPKP
ncbi:MAG: hypothetical protein IPM54_17110 [Polyangiaceae bacterium]|nr:hypothetical protein [Polyangiaceae bacterium]